jgi:hypothetical protein
VITACRNRSSASIEPRACGGRNRPSECPRKKRPGSGNATLSDC